MRGTSFSDLMDVVSVKGERISINANSNGTSFDEELLESSHVIEA